jgi:hypothetical protein
MPCPFPGMDPFLEIPPFWSDFTPKLLTAMSNQLLGFLIPKYEVRIDEYLVLEHDGYQSHRLRPDVVVSAPPSSYGSIAVAEQTDTSTYTEVAYPDFDPTIQRRLLITSRSSGKTVTVMELLSPVNKARGKDGIEQYEAKREELLTTKCHLIEIDLLRGGDRLPMRGDVPVADYFAYIGRAERRPNCQVIGWKWNAPLPPIPIPLLPEDGEIQLDLAGAFDAAYEPSFYDRRLPYHAALTPSLSNEDQDWLEARLSAMNE